MQTNSNRIPLNPSGLCLCGCGSPTPLSKRTERGYVRGEFVCYVIGHHRRSSPLEYIVDEETGCWNWQRSLVKGYGRIYTQDHRYEAAHRIFYERKFGRDSIPDGLYLDHLCRNRRCVNPDHLEPVSHAENLRRGSGAKLTAEQVSEIRRRYAEGSVTQVDLGAEFGVHAVSIHCIVRFKTWK